MVIKPLKGYLNPTIILQLHHPLKNLMIIILPIRSKPHNLALAIIDSEAEKCG